MLPLPILDGGKFIHIIIDKRISDKSRRDPYIKEFVIMLRLTSSIEWTIQTKTMNNKDHLIKPKTPPKTLLNNPRLTTLINFVTDFANRVTKL